MLPARGRELDIRSVSAIDQIELAGSDAYYVTTGSSSSLSESSEIVWPDVPTCIPFAFLGLPH
jgi:hypothetical protein